MIITRLLGGLGNQMFQYAAAKSLAERQSVDLRIDISEFAHYKLHSFELTRVFNCPHKEATTKDFQEVLGWPGKYYKARKLMQQPYLSSFRRKTFVIEPYFQYWDGFAKLEGDVYLLGYWQSEKYFQSVETVLREDFSFTEPLSGKNLALSEQIQTCSSVSLHIRRGDYVVNQKTNQVHGICSLDYYRRALSYVSERVKDPVIFLFSDDPEWVKENFLIPYPCVYVNHNSDKSSYRDMQLMSLCQHNIIANSSFSWWGAWLNANKDKIVITPEKWFADPVKQSVTFDLYPESWIKL